MRNYDYDDNEEYKNEIDKFWNGDEDDDDDDEEEDYEDLEEQFGYTKQESQSYGIRIVGKRL